MWQNKKQMCGRCITNTVIISSFKVLPEKHSYPIFLPNNLIVPYDNILRFYCKKPWWKGYPFYYTNFGESYVFPKQEEVI